MFRIKSLVLISQDGESYTYSFSEGLNYFIGANNTGKTVFYDFLDYMFGSSQRINGKPWFQYSLEKAILEFASNTIEYVLVRTLDPETNYFYYADEPNHLPIPLDEYKEKLNSVFTPNENLLKDIRNFTEENLTFRSFTMFNFLGETRQGLLNDFLDKCSDIEYSVKLNPILNFIFNSNLERIFSLKKELEDLEEELKLLEIENQQFEFIRQKVNAQLNILNIKTYYNGRNIKDVKEAISQIKSLEDTPSKKRNESVSELAALYNNISEQIKIYDNTIIDARNLERDNKNRKSLLESLTKLLKDNAQFEYLINPIANLIEELDKSISFNHYINSDKTISVLRNQKLLVKNQIDQMDTKFKMYSIDEKAKSIAIIEEYLAFTIKDTDEDLNEKRKKVKKLKEDIKVLQNSDDKLKINLFSDAITRLYMAGEEVSQVVKEDTARDGFRIQYHKRGNILQPVITKDSKDVHYYTGSMARHTLMQLCGYLCFLEMLIKEQRYPLIPILVVDHISKPFDNENSKTIGAVFQRAYEMINKSNLQIFIFDDEQYNDLNIIPDYAENLVNARKTGFNPFFRPQS